MVRFNRITEYGLIALKHMKQKKTQGEVHITSAREIANFYGLPFEVTAKTLQRLKEAGLIQSFSGVKGGYTLGCSLETLSLSKFLNLMEGAQALVTCFEEQGTQSCEYEARCGIKHLMGNLNQRINSFLSSVFLKDIL